MMPTADELISPAAIGRLARLLRQTPPETSKWKTVAASAAVLGPLALGERARTVADAILTDTGDDYDILAAAARRTLAEEDLTGWMIWPVTEAVATAATAGDAATADRAHFDDGLNLLAQLTPRLTSEFALRTFLGADVGLTPRAQGWLIERGLSVHLAKQAGLG